jgi:drug/metabolite transporter (DMT)-like permease
MDGVERQRYLGWALVALSAVAWSTAGYFTRLVSEDVWTILFWRGVFSGIAIAIVTILKYRGRALAAYAGLGKPGVLVALASATGMIAFIGSLKLTTVADVYVIYATVPFITAGIAWVALGERASPGLLLASGVALTGVVVTLTGARFGGSLLGQLVAFIMTISMALMTVIVRRHRDIALFPALGLSAWMAALASFWFCSPFDISAFDLAMLALFGASQSALGLTLFSFGSRMVPAAEATLLTALDVPLAPLWVWLAFSEVPSFYTLLGGAFVLAAVFGHVAYEMRRIRPPESSAAAGASLRVVHESPERVRR